MKAYAKINTFLKIIGTRGNYHELLSRFVLMEKLYDDLEFKPKQKEGPILNIISNIEFSEENIISKVYKKLCQLGFQRESDYFLKDYELFLYKRIPLGAGLGGGSSNAASFLLMLNEKAKLKLSKQEMIELSKDIGADIAFFLSQVKAANVFGIGEFIEEFDDEVPELELFTPNIHSNTAQVYQNYRKNFIDKMDKNLALTMKNLKSSELLEKFENFALNDLLLPYENLYKVKLNNDEFLSGSGSTYFKKGRK